MRVYREEITGQYGRTPMEYLRDSSLSLKEMAMLILIYCLPREWDLSIEGLSKIVADGTAGIRTTFRSLVKKGYIKQFRNRGSDGCFSGWDLYLRIHPVSPGGPSDRNPYMADPHVADLHEAELHVGHLHEVNRRESNNKESMIKESIIKESMAEETGMPVSGSGRTIVYGPEDRSARQTYSKSRSYPASPRGKNSFNNFQQREYNYPILEKQLLEAQRKSVAAHGSSEQTGTDK